jgi:PAS domain S-box-containing protein
MTDQEVKILLVEDLPTDALLARHELKKVLRDFTMQVVDQEPEFREALERFDPDLVITDFQLPAFDGLSALKIVQERSPLTPVILLTGSQNEDTAVECMKAGATDYVIKEHIKRLGQAVLSALEQKAVKLQKVESQNKLYESEQKYRTLFETMAQGVIFQDADGRILTANSSAERILGLSFDQMSGRTSFDPLWKSIREDGSNFPGEEHPAMVSLATGKECHAVMGIYNPKTDKYTWINVNSRPEFRAGEDKPWQVFTTFDDITPLKNLLIEVNLLNSELEERVELRTREILQLSGLQQAILGNAGLAIFSTSPEGTILLFNPAAEQMFGYSAGEVVGNMSPLRFHHPKELQQHAAYLSQITGDSIAPDFSVYTTWLFKEGTFSNEWTSIRKDGTTFPMHLTISSYSGDGGGIGGIIGIARDISLEKLAFESLERSEERFHAMFHEHAAIMLLVDPDTGIIIEANDAARKFYGYNFSPDEPITIADINLLTAEELKSELENAAQNQRNYFIFQHRLSSGEFRTVEVHSSPIEVRGGKVLFSVIHDITDRRLAEEKLIRSEAENRAILSAIPDILFRLDHNGTILYTHYTDEEQLYLPYEQFLGKRIVEVLPSDIADATMGFLNDAFKTKQIVTYEYALPVNNETHFYESRMVAISDIEALAIIRDVTKQTEALIALRRNETLMKMMTTSSPLAFLVIDQRNDDILFFNPRYCEIWGISHLEEKIRAKELKNSDLIPYCTSLLRDMDYIEESYKPLTDIENRDTLEDVITFTDGRFIRRYTAQIRGIDDEYYGRLYIFEDITERENLAYSLREAVLREKELNEMKSKFVSMASHEFRTPLASILMANETIENYFDRLSREEMMKYLERIRKNSEFLREMINKFLNLSRIETGRMPFHAELTGIVEFTDTWMNEYPVKHSVKHNLTFSGMSDEVYIDIDRQLFSQVLENLVSNAAKYSDEGSDIAITLQEEENSLTLSISDQGLGIPDDDQKNLFTPFFRASNIGNIHGTGLGLPLVKHVVDRHGGKIWFESRLNAGTTFYIQLPKKEVL